MAKQNRAAALAYVYADEGGYVERATEPGGAGNWGIAFTTFATWWKGEGKPGKPTFADLKAMPKSDADKLYGKLFMDPAHFDDLPAGVDYVVLDGFINGGGLIILRRAFGLPDKGTFNLGVLKLAQAEKPPAFVNKLCDTRLARNKTLKLYHTLTKPGGNTTFGMVWDRRTELVRKRALAMMEK